MSELKPCFKCGENGAPTIRCEEDYGRPCAPYSVECVECYSVSSPQYDTAAEATAWWNGYQTAVKDGAATKKTLTEQAAEYENRLVEYRNWQQQGVKRIEVLEAAINHACSCCWAKDATDAAQCRLCGLKITLKGLKS